MKQHGNIQDFNFDNINFQNEICVLKSLYVEYN